MFNLVEVPPDQQVLINDSPTRLTSIKLEPRETHDADENLHLAFIHLVQVIGEAARQVSREFTLTQPEVP